MKNSNNFKVICGTLAGIIIGGTTVVGANQAIQAIQNTEIKVSLNGQVQTFKDETTGEVQYPITYHNRTYLPLRNVAQLSGLTVDYNDETKTAILKDNAIDLFKGEAYNTETTNVCNIEGKNYWYNKPAFGEEEFEKFYIDGMDGKYVSRAIFFYGPQILSSGTLAMICGNDLYIAEWKEAESQNENGEWGVPNTIYAKKIESKRKVKSIMETSYDTGNIEEGTRHYLLVIYDDDSYEEIYMLNNEMASWSKDSTSFTDEQLIEKIKIYRENRGEYIPEFIVVDSESGDIVTLHLYDDMGTHIATSDWYYINRNTGKGENLLGEVIDLNKIDFLERTSSFLTNKKK